MITAFDTKAFYALLPESPRTMRRWALEAHLRCTENVLNGVNGRIPGQTPADAVVNFIWKVEALLPFLQASLANGEWDGDPV